MSDEHDSLIAGQSPKSSYDQVVQRIDHASVDSDCEAKPVEIEKSVLKEDIIAPKDNYYFIYFLFFLLGVGILFPWNAFITATQYFQQRFKGSPFVDNFENFFSIGYTVSVFVMLVATFQFQHNWNSLLRIGGSFLVMLANFIVTTVLIGFPQISPSAMFGVSLGSVILSGICNCFIQGGLMGIASQLPSVYVQSIMTGQAFAGVAVSFSQLIITAARSPTSNSIPTNQSMSETNTSALAYFLVAVGITACCIVGSYVVCVHSKFIRFYVTRQQDNKKLDSDGAVRKISVRRVYKKIWSVSLGCFFVFYVTLSMFPSVTVLIASVNASTHSARFYHDLFVPFHFVIYNIWDFIGRSITGIRRCHLKRRWLHAMNVARVVFIPYFLFSNVQLRDHQGNIVPSHIPVVFASDTAYFIMLSIFSVLNGYLGTSYMMTAPTLLDDDEKQMGGFMMVLSLIGGLMMGSFTSFFWRWTLCRCNPFTG